MNRIQLTDLIRAETRKALTEAISAQERKDLQDLGARLKTLADRVYQKQMKDTEDDRELRDLAEKDYADVIRVADALKNGNGEKATELFNRLDTSVLDVFPQAIWNRLIGIEDRAIAEEELADQLLFFESELKAFKALVTARRWNEALDAWKNIQRVAWSDTKSALEDLA